VDPEQVRDAAGLIDVLRRLRVSAGNPSLAVLARRSGVPRSTLADALSPKRCTLPPWDLVRRLTVALGGDSEQVRALGLAWKRLAAPVAGAAVSLPAVSLPASRLPASRLPRQLPAPPRLFTGRERELARLELMLAPPTPTDDATDDATGGTDGGGSVGGASVGGGSVGGGSVGGAPVAVICGPGGIGKTWLAVRWAHDHLDRFPDGQLYLDLRGSDPDGQPMPAVAALRSLLDGLGVAASVVPAEPAAQAALYRKVIVARRMLVVLDDARDTGQIAPLLPGSPTAATVLVTSRHRLDSGLDRGLDSLELGLFTDAEARCLLRRHLGAQRLDSCTGAAEALLRLCAGLPLALGIVAARAAAHPGFPLSVPAAELATARRDALDAGDSASGLRAVLAGTYQALDTAAARMFGLLGLAHGSGLVQGTGIGLGAAAALTGVGFDAARAALGELHRAHLVDEYPPGRYRMHDLVRRYAAECAAAEPVALRRLVEFYLRSAAAAAAAIHPSPRSADIDNPVAGVSPQAFADRAEAVAWFAVERAHLAAAQTVAADHGWQAAVVWLAAMRRNYSG